MSIFEVMGPIMIGPSSSHTAGPTKMGQVARLVFTDKIKNIDIYFHGSFAETYRGHGTDRAVIGGILGFNPDDERIRYSLEIAAEKGINISFNKIKLKNAHPNTMIIELKGENKRIKIRCASLGGGEIIVQEIDQFQVNISGQYPTFWIIHKDRPGVIALITTVLSRFDLNIAFMKVVRKRRGDFASSIIELDQEVGKQIVEKIEQIKGIKQVRYIPYLK